MDRAIKVNKSQLKPKLLGYLRRVEKRHEHIIITDRGRAVAKIIPFQETSRGVGVELKGSVLNYIDPLEPTGEKWEID